VILDWITENPTTVSEAAGKGVKEWKFFLEPCSWARDIPNVRCLGFSGAVRYRYVQPQTANSDYFLRFLDERATELTGLAAPSLDIVNSEFVPPSFEDLYAHIEGFGARNLDIRTVSTVTYAGLFRELADLEGWGNQISGWLDPRLLAKVTVPSKTSPGIRWKRLGYKTKKAALMPAVIEASRTIERMVETGECYTVPPCGVAGRGKRMDINRSTGDGAKKEGRLIVMPDLVRHLIGTLAAGPYMAAHKSIDKSGGGVMLGMGPFSEAYQDLSKWCEGASSFVFIDFKGFDSRIPKELLRRCMGHISTRFEAGRGTRAYWESEYNQLVETEIAMPDGVVYKKDGGVASGDPWTSLADSYANWVILKRATNRLGLKVKIWTFGDDSVIAIYDQLPGYKCLPAIKQASWDEFGMVVSEEKSYESEHLVGIDSDPDEKVEGSFLSLYFTATPSGIRPTRPLQDLYEMFLVPERNRKDLQWEIVRTSMAYLTFYYNENARYVIDEYWDWLHERYNVPQLTGSHRDLSLLREMDIPWSSFRWEWLNRLPRPGEVELMYKYGHVGFYPPVLWGAVYSRYDDDACGNVLSRAPHEIPPGDPGGGYG